MFCKLTAIMGMEYVEVIMRVEEDFGLDIPDEDAEKLATVGLIVNYVLVKTRSAVEDEPEIFRRIAQGISKDFDIPFETITRDSDLCRDLHLG